MKLSIRLFADFLEMENTMDSLYKDAIGSQIFWLLTEFAIIKNPVAEQINSFVQLGRILLL